MTKQFECYTNRATQNSMKWLEMIHDNPNIPESVIPYSVADSDLPHPPELIEGLKKYLDTMILGYTATSEAYYDSIRTWYLNRHQWDVRREAIVDSSGVVTALFNLVGAFTKVNDHVLILSPVYYPFKMSIELQERTVVESKLLIEANRYQIDFEDMEQKLKDPNMKVLIFCSPHNPVGRVWTLAELRRVSELCIANDVLIISDEIHFDLIMPGHKHNVFTSVSEEAKQHAIVVTAASKSFNLAGMQTSAIIIENDDLREQYLAYIAKQGFHALNALGPKATELAYRECEPWLDDFIALIDTNQKIFAEFMSHQLPQIIVYPLEGTYLQWFDCSGLGMESDELNQFLKKKCLLYLDDGAMFGAEFGQFQRMNLACPSEKLLEGLARLKDCVDQL